MARPPRFETTRRTKRFLELVAQGNPPDLAAKAVQLDPYRALRILGEVPAVLAAPQKAAA